MTGEQQDDRHGRRELRRVLADRVRRLVDELADQLVDLAPDSPHGSDGSDGSGASSADADALVVGGARELAQVRAVTLMSEVAARSGRQAVIGARAGGRSWDEVAAALGLTDGPAGSRSRGRRAFEQVASWPVAGPPQLTWRCGSCGHPVTDHGPDYGPASTSGTSGAGGCGVHPRAQELGHGDLCARMAAHATAWETARPQTRRTRQTRPGGPASGGDRR